jgi:iron complex transport system permease protein
MLLSFKAGSSELSWTEIFRHLLSDKTLDVNTLLIQEIRLPKTITALIAGWILAQCGLSMQTYFQNPLAGPYVLGISSGAQLGAAAVILGSSIFHFTNISAISVVSGAFIGALCITLIILVIARRFNQMTFILIIGLLINYFISSIQSLLEYYASANNLKQFNTWQFGSLNQLGLQELQWLIPIIAILSLCFLLLSKPMNWMAAGKTNASALGLNMKRFSTQIVTLTSICTALITAYCGPIGFLGMIVPFTIKWLTRSNQHFYLLLLSGIYGAALLLLADYLSYQAIQGQYIPINIILGMIGIPAIILYLFKFKSVE